MNGAVETYVEWLAGTASTGEIARRLQELLQQLGFDRYSYYHARPPLGKQLRSFVPLGSPRGKHVHEFLVTLPAPRVDHYRAHAMSEQRRCGDEWCNTGIFRLVAVLYKKK